MYHPYSIAHNADLSKANNRSDTILLLPAKDLINNNDSDLDHNPVTINSLIQTSADKLS